MRFSIYRHNLKVRGSSYYKGCKLRTISIDGRLFCLSSGTHDVVCYHDRSLPRRASTVDANCQSCKVLFAHTTHLRSACPFILPLVYHLPVSRTHCFYSIKVAILLNIYIYLWFIKITIRMVLWLK